MKKQIFAAVLAGSVAVSGCATNRYADSEYTTSSDETLEGAGTGAVVGGAVGAGVGAVVGGINPLAGALIGAAVGGIAGAIWADRNNDGQVDGYYRNGEYIEGQPTQEAYQQTLPPAPYYPPAPPVRRSGERG